jgi:hypothetical protein
VKIFYCFLAAAVLCLCACTVVPLPVAPTAASTADGVALVDGFEPAFYRAFLQNGYDSPARLEPVRILQGAFRVFMQTQDDEGRAIDASSLDSTERTLIDAARIWSGETFGITEVARGTGTREKVFGWITVKWSRAALGDRCGRSTVGVDGGYIELNISGACSCGLVTGVYPRLVRHELGHAMGYYHTGDRDDVMYGQPIAKSGCDIYPSERERRLAIFAHAQTR